MRLNRPVRTRFRYGFLRTVNIAAYGKLAGSFFKRHAVTHTRLPTCEARRIVGSRFPVLFHSPPGVLFTFPSRYWFTIGRQGVLSLGGWAPRIHTGFHGSRVTREHRREVRRLSPTGLLPSVAGPFHGPRLDADFVTPWRVLRPSWRVPLPRHGNAAGLSRRTGLGSSPFARRYWGSRGCFPFLGVLRCFSSPGSLRRPY